MKLLALVSAGLVGSALMTATPAFADHHGHGWKWKTVCKTVRHHGHVSRECHKVHVRW